MEFKPRDGRGVKIDYVAALCILFSVPVCNLKMYEVTLSIAKFFFGIVAIQIVSREYISGHHVDNYRVVDYGPIVCAISLSRL